MDNGVIYPKLTNRFRIDFSTGDRERNIHLSCSVISIGSIIQSSDDNFGSEPKTVGIIFESSHDGKTDRYLHELFSFNRFCFSVTHLD